MSVALSADGNIAILGGFAEDGGVALVFTRTGGHWTHEKIGTGAVGKSAPSVALSADETIVVGRSNENGGIGTASVFTRGGGGSDYREPPRPSAISNPVVNLQE